MAVLDGGRALCRYLFGRFVMRANIEAVVGCHVVAFALPAHPYTNVLRMQQRLSRDGMVSVEGNEYSVPDTLTRRVIEVHRLAAELRLYDRGALVAVHPVLEGQGQRRVTDGHCTWPPPGGARTEPDTLSDLIPVGISGEHLAERSLEVCERLGRALTRASIAAGEQPEMGS